MAERELKPCPFCGGEVTIAQGGSDITRWWFITRGNDKDRCDCRLFMESDDFYINASLADRVQKRRELIKAWNRRVEDG